MVIVHVVQNRLCWIMSQDMKFKVMSDGEGGINLTASHGGCSGGR